MENSKSELLSKKILFFTFFNESNESKVCYKCEIDDFYINSDYLLICKNCKSKQTVYRNTFFHNNKIGLTKTIEISIEYYLSNFKLTTVYVSKEYKISQKSASKLLIEIRKDISISRRINKVSKINDSTLEKRISKLKKIYKIPSKSKFNRLLFSLS